MPMLADRVDYVIGIDCHKDRHVAAIADRLGGLKATLNVTSDADGYRSLLKWADKNARGRRVWAIEGAGSYGAGLTDWLAEKDEWMVEVDRPKRPKRKAGIKSDEVDALRAAKDALAAKRLAEPRRRGGLEAVRVLKISRKQAVQVSAVAVVQLKALVVSAPEGLRARLRGLSAAQLVATCAALRNQPSQSAEWAATLLAMRSVARRAQAAAADAAELDRELTVAVKAQAPPRLLGEVGVGTVVAAELLTVWSHKGRLHSEAAFAMVAGAAPIEASSGQVIRHRLSRSGDRQLNSALHTVVLTRWRQDERTQAYIARRRAEGKSDREIRRCLKRHIARHLFRLMEAAA
jgi:transposase